MRCGARPPTNAFWAWLTSTASVDSSSDTSIRWPDAPVSPARASSPARTETVPNSPVTTSLMATPTFVGSPPSASVAPVIDISPPTAWITKS